MSVEKQMLPDPGPRARGRAAAGVRALRERLAGEVPAFGAAAASEAAGEAFCRQIRTDLRRERKIRGVDQTAMAALLDMTQSAVSKIETGDGDLGVKTVFRFAHALGLQPVCIFVPTGSYLLQEAPESGHAPKGTENPAPATDQFVKAIEDLQVGLIRETSEKVTSAMQNFARAIR